MLRDLLNSEQLVRPEIEVLPADSVEGGTTADLEKVLNRPQAENSELYNVLKIARFTTNDEQKYMYQMFVRHYQILKS